MEFLEILFEYDILKIKFGIFENLFEDGILKIKFEILEFLENLFKNGILKIKIGNWNFRKIYLKMEF